MGFFEKLLNRAEDALTRVQDAAGEIAAEWSEASFREAIRDAMLKIVLIQAKAPPRSDLKERLQRVHLEGIDSLITHARQIGPGTIEEQEGGDEEFEKRLDRLTTRIMTRRPDLSVLTLALGADLEPHLENIARTLVALDERRKQATDSSSARQARRAELLREYSELTKTSSYDDLNRSSLFSDVVRTASISGAAVRCAFDIPRLEETVRKYPRDPMGYVDLAEALTRSRPIDEIRRAVRGVFNPLGAAAFQVVRWVKGDAPPREVVLARTALLLSRRILAVDRTNDWALVAAGRAHLLLGDLEASARCLKLALALRPAVGELYYYLAIALDGLGYHKTALDYLVIGTRMGSASCAHALETTIESFDAERGGDTTSFPELRAELDKGQEADDAGRDIGEKVGQFVGEKVNAVSRLGRRLERAFDQLILSGKEPDRD
ncbi:MAG: hypothetical protein OZ922_06355 [Myxococcales bacterium]|jgi:tetratricopeptide (TPR) repeat protein|nr:hypothetical protein [Myxococcales bacterium]